MNFRFLIVVSLPCSLKEELIKDPFTYVPSESQTQETSVNDNPPEEQQQLCEEAVVAGQLEEEAQPDFCPLKPKKQVGDESFSTKIELEPSLNVAARPSLWKDDAPSFNLGISPLTSQPTPPTSQLTLTQIEILTEAVIDAGVAAALKFATKTTEELRKKCYHWMTHVKETKDSTNEYDAIFVFNHEAHLEGLRHHFQSCL
ncbi:hypothetical protein AHAS_Ahas14G0119600 [Arachis hypogaea]